MVVAQRITKMAGENGATRSVRDPTVAAVAISTWGSRPPALRRRDVTRRRDDRAGGSSVGSGPASGADCSLVRLMAAVLLRRAARECAFSLLRRQVSRRLDRSRALVLAAGKVRRMVVVGLTGGIGAGKSSVSARLAERGAVIVDADAITRELQEP